MADIHVRSTDGSDSDTGATWALSKATGTGAAAIDAAGDRILFSQSHAESTASAVTFALAGTMANPTQALCVNDAAEPPTALATTATITTTGASNLSISGSCYTYGLAFHIGTGSSAASFVANSASSQVIQVFDTCTIALDTTAASHIQVNEGAAKIVFKGCTFRFGNSGDTFYSDSYVEIEGGGFDAATVSPTYLFRGRTSNRFTSYRIVGFDFSNLGTSFDLFYPTNSVGFKGVVIDAKLPSGWAGDLINTAINSAGQRFEMFNATAGSTHYYVWIDDYYGKIRDETVIVRSGSTSDFSLKMTSNANASYPIGVLRSQEIVREVTTTGSAVTATIEIAHDSQGAGTSSAAQNNEIWMEVLYFGTSGQLIGSFISDAPSDVLATAADQTSSSETWTTTGMTTPVNQKLSVTFTPQVAGYIHARVCLAKASKTYYVDPDMAVA